MTITQTIEVADQWILAMKMVKWKETNKKDLM